MATMRVGPWWWPRPQATRCGAFRLALLASACFLGCIEQSPAEPVQVAHGVYAILGTGGEISAQNEGRVANVAFVVGARGVVVVDSGISYRQGEDIIAEVKRVTTRPVVLVILSHPSQEVIFGATAFQARAIPVLAHKSSAELMASRCETCLRNLRSVLGAETMAETKLVVPDRLLERDETIDAIGRPLRIIAPEWSSAPGAIAVLDETTSTLITGTLVSIRRIPELRDADPKAWRAALVDLASTRCQHLIPAYGPIGTCADIPAFAEYLDDLERHVGTLLKEGVSLGELPNRSGLPRFSGWDQYGTLHPQNANRTYLRLERAQFN